MVGALIGVLIVVAIVLVLLKVAVAGGILGLIAIILLLFSSCLGTDSERRHWHGFCPRPSREMCPTGETHGLVTGAVGSQANRVTRRGNSCPLF